MTDLILTPRNVTYGYTNFLEKYLPASGATKAIVFNTFNVPFRKKLMNLTSIICSGVIRS